MADFSKILELNPETVDVLSEVYSGYGSALEKNEDTIEESNHLIASSFLISAIYKTINNPGSATSEFKKAAEYYFKEKNGYWIIPAICSNDREDIDKKARISAENKEQFNFFNDFLIRLSTNRKIDYESLSELKNLPVGTLNIPFEFYLKTFRDIEYYDSSMHSYSQILNRTSEYLNVIRSDSYHWENLSGSFLPVDPELLGISICLVKKIFSQKKEIFTRFKDQLEVDDFTKIPFLLAEQIIITDSDLFLEQEAVLTK